MRLRSPAKLNLFLRVLQRRQDGYHELASLFQAIDLFDTLHFALAPRDSLTCSDPTLPTDGSNLVLKAVQLFRRKSGLNFGVSIHLEKKIPHQAGLGGGSGNAATTLWGLNQLLGKPASDRELAQWAGKIGSDIPFFLTHGSAYCTGRGEIMRPLPPLTSESLWIVKPPEGSSTPAVYGKLNLAQLPQRDPEQCLEQFLAGTPCYFNDLEEAALAVTPALALLKQALLDQGYPTVLLCGSGSSFCCMGKEVAPIAAGCSIFAAHYLYRPQESWY
jgi:4-diphosphocytidyl-2-C-methyl-D-erythritol kinase